jgi:hypothetical protein
MPLYSAIRSHPGIRSAFTTYYSPASILISSTSTAVAANAIYYLPFCIPNVVFDRIGIEVTTGAAGAARLGLYTNDGGMPGALILDAGTVDTTNIAIVEATITARAASDEWIWAAAVFDATPTCRNGTASGSSFLGSTSTSSGQRGLTAAFSYAALPAAAPTATGGSTAAPMVFLRKS